MSVRTSERTCRLKSPSAPDRRELSMAITINREQRDAIYQEILTDLNGVGDIWIALHSEDYETARRFRRRFEDDMRLLDDLGWEETQERDQFELTMPGADLGRVIGHFNQLLGEAVRAHISEPEEERQLAERALVAQTAFGSVLSQVAAGVAP
jgi:chromosome condensin MukBEF ATPase and DNA-binding subunit MukB